MKLISEENLTLSSVDPCDRALEAYQAITAEQNLLIERGWSNEDILLSRYYWLRLYIRMREDRVGFDAGLEQQAFQILEYPVPDCAPDWRNIGQVEEAVNLRLGES